MGLELVTFGAVVTFSTTRLAYFIPFWLFQNKLGLFYSKVHKASILQENQHSCTFLRDLLKGKSLRR